MSLLSDIASEHQAQRTALAKRAAARADVLWSRMDVRDLDASWDVVAPRLTAEVVAGQVASAAMATPYLSRVGLAAGDAQDAAVLAPESFGGMTFDGREVGPAMFGAVTTTKRAIGAGFAPSRAFESGASFLAVIVQAAITDMGRSADSTLSTGKGYTRYVRCVSPGACSRCAILAGSKRFSKPFLRHPACKCTSLPVQSGVPDGLFSSPRKYFDSLSSAEQERVFGAANAEAIRMGADPVSVVNAGRGAYMRAGRQVTKTGTSVRAAYGRSELARSPHLVSKGAGDRYRTTVNVRLTPESILAEAGGDLVVAKAMLRQYGYLR